MKSRLILVSVMLAIAGLAAALLLRTPQGDSATSAVQGASKDVIAGTEADAVPADAASGAAISSPFPNDADQGCLSPAQIETHPAFATELARLDQLMTNGPNMDSYRYLHREALLELAEQDDSAAMAVLGARHFLRFRGLDETQAIAYLRFEDTNLRSGAIKQSLTQGEIKELQAAREWFYQAALHGRLYALVEMSMLSLWRRDGPVELGWIGAEEYAELEAPERRAIDPAIVYTDVVRRLAPQSFDGPAGEAILDIRDAVIASTQLRSKIVEQLANDFERDRRASGLPPVTVEAYRGPTLEEIESLLCDSYLEGHSVD